MKTKYQINLLIIITALFVSTIESGVAQSPSNPCNEELVKLIDEQPKYPSGQEGMIEIFDENATISVSKKPTNYEILLELVICTDGSFTIDRVMSEQKLSETFYTEAKRLTGLLEKFKPAMKDGIAVANKHWIQINFDPKKKLKNRN